MPDQISIGIVGIFDASKLRLVRIK